MRLIVLLILFLPLAASAQKTDTTKREPRLRSYSVGLSGGYGTDNLYSAGIWTHAHFRKISYKIDAAQSITRTQGHSFSVITYRGLGTHYYNYGMNPATSFPETFRSPVLNRLTKQASGVVAWEPTEKIKIYLSGSYRWTDDSVGFAVQRQVFTGSDFRTINSTHTGGMITERKNIELDFKYPASGDNSIIKFKSALSEESQDITLLNRYTDTTSGKPWGFIAEASNRDISNKVDWVNSASLDKLWLPWVRFDKNDGPTFKRKSIRLRLAHTYRMQQGNSHLYTRTDLVPDIGSVTPGSDRIYFINSSQPTNEVSATLSMSELVRIKRPEIEIDFVFGATYSEQPWMQSATRIDGTGENSEDELYINAVLTTKQVVSMWTYWYKHIGFTLTGQSTEIAVRHESGETISKRKFMLLPRVKFIFKKIQGEFTSTMLSPAAVNLLPNPDWRNPAYIEYGNPTLGFGRKNELSLERGFYKTITSRRDSTVKYRHSVTIDGLISHSKNPVMWIMQPDSAGILFASPVNLPYVLNTNTIIHLSRQLFPSLTLTSIVGHDWLRYYYTLSDTLRTLNNQTVRAHMSCAYQPGKNIVMKLYGGYTLVHADYTSEKLFTRTFQSFDASFWFDVKFFDQLRFYVICNAVHFTGPEQTDEKTFFYVSSNLEWLKPEARFTVRLAVNDLFNQNIYFARNDAHGMVQQVSGVAPGRYAMLTASWGISK